MDSLLARVVAHPDIVVKGSGIEGILAANFTRRAFFKGAWDETTVKARGLFLDASTGEIVARGYDKFFNVGEPNCPFATLDEAVPALARKKYNGFLAIVAPDRKGGLMVLSKAGITDFSVEAERVLRSTYSERQLKALADFLGSRQASATFEILSSKDPHLIKDCDTDTAVLLDVVLNVEEMTFDHLAQEALAVHCGFFSPDTYRITDPKEFDTDCEGWVIRVGDKMAKVKSETYLERKAFRRHLTRYLKNGSLPQEGQRGFDLFQKFLQWDGELESFTVMNPSGQLSYRIPDLISAFN